MFCLFAVTKKKNKKQIRSIFLFLFFYQHMQTFLLNFCIILDKKIMFYINKLNK